MSAEICFLDTNVLVYLFDCQAPEKQAAARRLWSRACTDGVPLLSTQVLQEFFVTVTRTAKQGLSPSQARQAMMAFAEAAEVVPVTVSLIETATRRVERSGFSFWDSLIVETAIDSGARWLFTEDLQDGQMIGQLKVTNPFRTEFAGP